MDRITVALLITLVGAFGLSNKTQVEILTSPSRVYVQKPEPFPFVKFENSSVTLDSNNLDVNNITENENGTDIYQNRTCIKQDYEDYAAAVFLNEVKPLEEANYLFNSSLEFSFENYLNVTDFEGLKFLEETPVDCNLYFATPITRKLNFLSLGSLAGPG